MIGTVKRIGCQMPIDLGVAGYALPQHERVTQLVTAVGGPVKAAALTGRSRAHIDNMRKPGAALRLDDMLALCKEAGYSLDWVATGYQVRPDLQGRQMPPDAAEALQPVQLLPVQPEVRDGTEFWEPSEFAIGQSWLARRGLSPESARYVRLADDGMAPRFGSGAFAIVDVRPGALKTGVYAVGIAGEWFARRLQRLPDGRSELVADAMPNWQFSVDPGNQTLYLHRVVWVGQDV